MAEPDQRMSALVVDGKGDLVERLLQGFAHRAPHMLDRVRVLDPFAPRACKFNLCRLPLGGAPVEILALLLAGLVASLSTGAGSQSMGVGARQVELLQLVFLAVCTARHSGTSVLWALDAFVEKRGFKMLAALSESVRARQFLLSANPSDDLRASCSSRLRLACAATTQIEDMLSANEGPDFETWLGPGQVLCVDVGRPTGGLTALRDFYASVFAALAIDFLLARPSGSGHPTRIVIDEAQTVAGVLDTRIESIATVGRSKQLAATIMSQGTVLLQDASNTLVPVLMGNLPTKLIGRLAPLDAQLLAKQVAPGHGVDERAGTTRERFIATTCNLPDRTFTLMQPGSRSRFVSADVDVPAWEAAARTHADKIEAARLRLALPEVTPPRVTLADAFEAHTGKARKGAASAKTTTKPRSRWG